MSQNTPTNLEDKANTVADTYKHSEPVFIKTKQCGQVLDSLLEQYNDFITVINKRMIYLDHLITQKEKERGIAK